MLLYVEKFKYTKKRCQLLPNNNIMKNNQSFKIIF